MAALEAAAPRGPPAPPAPGPGSPAAGDEATATGEGTAPGGWADLPAEVLEKIFHLAFKANHRFDEKGNHEGNHVARAACTCKAWHRLVVLSGSDGIAD